jgi:hypothetical protein
VERSRRVLSEPSYRSRLREATRTDWRFLLGLTPADVVLAAGADEQRLAASLAPWVREVHRLEPGPPANSLDWAFFSGSVPASSTNDGDVLATLGRTFAALRPGGHIAMTLENRWGLHWIADWRTRSPRNEPTVAPLARHGLRWHRETLRRVGADQICAYALLPSRDAPRAIIPIDPPCPPAAQRMALDQVWQRATPAAALMRRAIGVLVDSGIMRHLYPHYLVVGRKPC